LPVPPDFTGEKNSVQDRVDLVEIEGEVQLADVLEEGIFGRRHFFARIGRHKADPILQQRDVFPAEEEPRVSSIYRLVIPELSCTAKTNLPYTIATNRSTRLLVIVKRNVSLRQV